MDLVTPGIGLTFWTVLIFGLLLIILRLVAWKPINQVLDKRSKSIDEAISAADKARIEMKELKANNEVIIAQAKSERDKILVDARNMSEKIVSEAKNEANQEVKQLIENAKKEIDNMKKAAYEDIKNQVVDLSIAVAQKVIKKELDDSKVQDELINDLLKDAKLN